MAIECDCRTLGYRTVARAAAAAAASVSKENDPARLLGNVQRGPQPYLARGDENFSFLPALRCFSAWIHRKISFFSALSFYRASRSGLLPTASQQVGNLLVGYLREILVEFPNRSERLRCIDANKIVNFLAQSLICRKRRHGSGHNQSRRLQMAQGRNGRSYAGTCGDAVVHQDRCASLDIERRPGASVETLAPVQFSSFPGGHLFDSGFRYPDRPDDLGIENANPAAGDGSERQFLLPRDSELAGHEYVELDAQCLGNLESNGNSSARNTQHGNILSVGIRLHLFREHAACFCAIRENHHGSPTIRRLLSQAGITFAPLSIIQPDRTRTAM